MTKLRITDLHNDSAESFEKFQTKPTKRESVTRSAKVLETNLEHLEQSNRKLSRNNLALTNLVKRLKRWLPKDEWERITKELEALAKEEEDRL